MRHVKRYVFDGVFVSAALWCLVGDFLLNSAGVSRDALRSADEMRRFVHVYQLVTLPLAAAAWVAYTVLTRGILGLKRARLYAGLCLVVFGAMPIQRTWLSPSVDATSVALFVLWTVGRAFVAVEWYLLAQELRRLSHSSGIPKMIPMGN